MAHPSGPLEHFGYGFCSDDDKTFLMNAHKGWQSIDDHTCDLACLVEQSKQLCNEAQFIVKTCAMDGATLADSACTVGAQVGCAGMAVYAEGSTTKFLARLFIPGGVATIEPYTDSAGDTYNVNQHETGGTLTGYMASNTGSSGWHWWAKGTNPTTRTNNGKCTSFGKNSHVNNLQTTSQVCSPECYGRSDAAPAAAAPAAAPPCTPYEGDKIIPYMHCTGAAGYEPTANFEQAKAGCTADPNCYGFAFGSVMLDGTSTYDWRKCNREPSRTSSDATWNKCGQLACFPWDHGNQYSVALKCGWPDWR